MPRFAPAFIFLCGLCFLSMSCSLFGQKDRGIQRALLHLEVGKSLMANGKLPEALAEFNMAEQLDPKNPEVQSSMGLVYQLRNRPKEAEERFLKALKLAPKFTDVRSSLARLYIDTGKYREALVQIRKIEDDLTYPAPEKALVLKGMVYFKQKKYTEAEGVLSQAYQVQRDGCLGAYFLGRTYYEQKRFNEAAQVLDQAVASCKGARFEEPLFYSAMAYYGRGSRLEAKARAEELINDYPKSALANKVKALLKILEE